MQVKIGSLEIGARLEPNYWGKSLNGVATWLSEHATIDFTAWGDDWKHEDMGAAALVGPVTLRAELHQCPRGIRVVDVLGAFWEVLRELPSLLEDKDPLAEPEFVDVAHYDPVAARQHLADVVVQYEAHVSRKALAEIPDSALETMFGTTNREEILRMVKGRDENERPCWVSPKFKSITVPEVSGGVPYEEGVGAVIRDSRIEDEKEAFRKWHVEPEQKHNAVIEPIKGGQKITFTPVEEDDDEYE